MNAVLGTILENLDLIEIVYEETVEAFKGDKSKTSDSKEVTISQFVGSYLTPEYQVKSQSKIYSKTQETNNIDCVVLAPNHPRLITPKREVILAEGVYFAIEVKPDISTLTDKSEFYRGLLQIKSIKNINREIESLDLSKLMKRPPLPKYFDKIPAIIFSSKSSTLKNTVDFISKKVAEGKLGYEELPDMIVCMDKGIIFYHPDLSYSSIASQMKNEGNKIPKRGFVCLTTKEKSHLLVVFLATLLSYKLPTIQVSGFIINKYLSDINLPWEANLYELK